jgi:hypothetical protein
LLPPSQTKKDAFEKWAKKLKQRWICFFTTKVYFQSPCPFVICGFILVPRWGQWNLMSLAGWLAHTDLCSDWEITGVFFFFFNSRGGWETDNQLWYQPYSRGNYICDIFTNSEMCDWPEFTQVKVKEYRLFFKT